MSQRTPSSVKTLIILILLCIVGIQGYFLAKGFHQQGQTPPGQQASLQPASGQGVPAQATPQAEPASGAAPVDDASKPVEIATFHHNGNKKGTVVFSFTAPVGEAESSGPLVNPPFTISPDVVGVWTWAGPYFLIFTAADKNAFDPSETYVFKAQPANFLPQGRALAGRTEFAIKPQPLTVRAWSAEANPVEGKPGLYAITGSVSFSKDIVPRQMAPAVRLIDPMKGEAAPVPLNFVMERGYPRDTLRFVSDPVEATAKERMFTILVDKDKAEAEDGYKLAAQQAYAFPVSHAGQLVALTPTRYKDVQEGWELSFNAKVDPAALRERITLEPPVDGFSVGRDYGGRMLLTGNFKPGLTYALTIAKGLTALNGAIMPNAATFNLAAPNKDPEVSFAHQGMFLPASGAGNVALSAVNVKGASVRIERVYRNNIFFALNYYEYGVYNDDEYGSDTVLPYLGDAIADFKIPVAGPLNQPVNVPVDVAARVKAFEPGLYHIVASRDAGSYPRSQKWMLITDLGIAAKRGHDDLLVWVCSQKNLAPVAGTRVKLVSATNQVIFQGVTDARGLWHVKGLADLPEDKAPFMVTAEKDKDFSFLQFDRFKTDMTGLDVSGVEVAEAGYQAFAWGERDIYRPGETVSGVVCVRDAELKTPPPLPLKLRWTDPQGREVAVENLKTGDQGMAVFTRAIPVHYPTGPYEVSVVAGEDVIGQYRFQVEDFKPDRISTNIVPNVERAAPGQELSFTVEGRYLFGAPASGLRSEAQVTLTPAPFAPKGFDEYVFGDPNRSFEPTTVLQEEAALDEEGRAVYKASIPAGLKPPAALTAVVTARVSEAGGRGVAARARIPVDAYLLYPGLKRLGDSGLEPGKPHQFEYVMVDGQGREAQARTLVAELLEDRWQTVLVRSDSGSGYKYETRRDSRLVDRRELASPGSKGSVSFTPPKYGSYRLVLSDPKSGAASQLTFWASGQGYNPWAVENPARLELVPSKTDWMPGETARLQVRSPYPGKLLVTVESTGVRDVILADLPANTGEVSVPIKAGYGPNIYVTAMLARKGADVLPGQAGRAFGSVSLNVAREAGRQEVAILTPDLIKPNTQLTITAKADPGSVVTIAAVDEGILQLIAQKTPDPWAAFYAKRALEVDSFDTWALILPEVAALAKKSPAGGDEDLSRFLRTESPQGEKSVAFWSGPLTADAQGRVRFTVDVPQFQGALRVMAVAVKGERFGSGQRVTRVKSPLVLLPTFPRFAQLDETMQLPVTLRNDTPDAGTFQISLDATGPMSADEPVKKVDIQPGKDATVFFTVKTAGTEGVATLALKAAGNGEATGATASLLVRSPLPAVSRIVSGVNDGPKVTLDPAGSQGFLPATVRRDLRIGRSPVVRFSGKLENLLGYPYGCIEQTVSRSFPLLYFANLARELEPKALEGSSPEAMVQQGVSRALSMQLPSGGFGMWPGSGSEQQWASVYAAHFLHEAGRAGYQVPKDAMAQALAFVADLVKQRFQGRAVKTQAYGLYVLALAGRPDRGAMDHMRDRLGAKMPPDARALLAAAYAATGNAKGGEALIANLPGPEPAPRSDDIFDSDLRSVALTLAALVDAAPASPQTAATARDLARLMETAPVCSTQEAGMAFMALGKLYARQQAQPACSGQVLSGDAPLAAFDTSKTAVLAKLAAPGALTLALDPACKPGSVYYSLDTRGIPEAASYQPSANGLTLTREFLGRDGSPLDMAALKQGTVVVIKTTVASTMGPVSHVAVSQLLPSGLEVENPRLATTDSLPWMDEPSETTYADYRADRVNVFLDVPAKKAMIVYTLCRAVIPGSYTLPPAQAESMYYPEIKAGTALGAMSVVGGQ